MLNLFDLYDLYAIFRNIRYDPACALNEEIMSNTLGVLKDRNDHFEINQFRSALCTLDLRDHQEYAFVFTQNVYPYIPCLIKEEAIYQLLEDACEGLLHVIGTHNDRQI